MAIAGAWKWKSTKTNSNKAIKVCTYLQDS